MKLGPKQTKWVEELESGRWKQGRGQLHELIGEEESGKEIYSHCCLGVADKVFDLDSGDYLTLDPQAREQLGLYDGAGGFKPDEGHAESHRACICIERLQTYKEFSSLAEANDNGLNFAEIAKFIREHPELIFTEPK